MTPFCAVEILNFKQIVAYGFPNKRQTLEQCGRVQLGQVWFMHQIVLQLCWEGIDPSHKSHSAPDKYTDPAWLSLTNERKFVD